MLRSAPTPVPLIGDVNATKKRTTTRSALNKRPHSISPASPRIKSPVSIKKSGTERRCQSLSPSNQPSIRSMELTEFTRVSASTPQAAGAQGQNASSNNSQAGFSEHSSEKEQVLPQCVLTKMLRSLATKKREFLKMRKSLIHQQNTLLEQYSALKDMESRAGVTTDELGDVRIVSVSSWPAHDLLLLLRDDLVMPASSEIHSHFGTQVLQQMSAQLNHIPEEVLGIGAEIMARRMELLNLLRGKNRPDRAAYLPSSSSGYKNLEWKSKNIEFDNETEKLHRMVAALADNLKAKINYTLDLARLPWQDRETLLKRIERLQKDNLILQNKIEDASNTKKDDELKDGDRSSDTLSPTYQAMSDELARERAARETMKEVVSAAESMLRVARARIATLERMLKDTRAELEVARRKHKDLEQLYRHRETSFDARSKKLIEVSKTGEMTIEALSQQRDALELRVKELREQAEMGERDAEIREAEQRARADSLQAKVLDEEKSRVAAESRAAELEARVKEFEVQLYALRERSVRLVDMERRRCIDYVPSKESEPSDRETELWKELQVTRVALSKAEEELRQSRADKDSFLNSLSKIAGEGTENFQDKMATELLDREQKIVKLQHQIEEYRENEKSVEQTMTQYENKLAALRLEVKRLRCYDCYSKETPFQEIQTELLETHMQVETLSRERAALITAAASRALMLERHERGAELFARMTRTRRELAALLDGRTEPPPIDDTAHAEVSCSLSSACADAADTWSALRAERARVLRLESAVLAQSLQLEREGRVRTQLERRRSILEREVLRVHHCCSAEHTLGKNPSLVFHN